MVRPRSCRVIHYFDTPALGRRHQSFGRVNYRDKIKMRDSEDIIMYKEAVEKLRIHIFLNGLDA